MSPILERPPRLVWTLVLDSGSWCHNLVLVLGFWHQSLAQSWYQNLEPGTRFYSLTYVDLGGLVKLGGAGPRSEGTRYHDSFQGQQI